MYQTNSLHTQVRKWVGDIPTLSFAMEMVNPRTVLTHIRALNRFALRMAVPILRGHKPRPGLVALSVQCSCAVSYPILMLIASLRRLYGPLSYTAAGGRPMAIFMVIPPTGIQRWQTKRNCGGLRCKHWACYQGFGVALNLPKASRLQPRYCAPVFLIGRRLSIIWIGPVTQEM